jgi:hypothetical protein
MSQVAEIKEIMESIKTARYAALRKRRAVLGLLLCMFAVFGMNVYQKIVTYDTEVLMATLQKNAAHMVWPLVSDELDSISEKAIPIITDALTTEVMGLGTKLTDSIQAEEAVFQTNMAKYMKKALERDLKNAFNERNAELSSHYSQFSDGGLFNEELAENLQKRCQQWAQDELDKSFSQHLMILQSINETVQELSKQTRANSGDAGKASMEDLVLIVTEILNSRLNAEE